MTTNLTLEELKNPEDIAHARIYDRFIEMCTPAPITGENFRKAKARDKMEQLKMLPVCFMGRSIKRRLFDRFMEQEHSI